MSRDRTGTLERNKGFFYVKITIDGRPRQRIKLGKISEMSEARARDKMQVVLEAIALDNLTPTAKGSTPAGVTTEDWGRDWTTGALFERYGAVNGLKKKKSAKQDHYRLNRYVYPKIGPKKVADVTDADIDLVFAGVPTTRRSATVAKVYLAVHRLFDLAIMPGRLRKDNPVTRYHKPRKDPDKLFAYLFPAEFMALMKAPPSPTGTSAGVPTERKVLYCIGCYTGLRKGSLFGIRWCDVDFANGVLTVVKTKTGVPLLFEIPSGLLWVLEQWKRVCGGKGTEPVVVKRVKRDEEATVLRMDLRAAGVERETLFTSEDGIEPLRFHDLRATFVTWAKRAGRGDGWITDRTGHISEEMVTRYSRAARTLADLRITPFPELVGSIPELTESSTESSTDQNAPTAQARSTRKKS